MADGNGNKTGGRAPGTPNKATQKVREFLDGVFDEVFADPAFRALLITQLRTLSIDSKLLTTLLQYYAGRPSLSVDHTHEGTVTLAQIIAGRVPTDDTDPPSQE